MRGGGRPGDENDALTETSGRKSCRLIAVDSNAGRADREIGSSRIAKRWRSTVSEDVTLATGVSKRPAERSKVTCQC